MSTTAKERTAHVPAQNRKQIIVERRSTSKQRTLLVE